MKALRLVPVSLREANAYVDIHHRHSQPVRGCLFCVGIAGYDLRSDEICGVAIVGRPVARGLQDGFTAEVLRVCTDGTLNACSMLYGAAWRGCKAMGYTRAVTYTLTSESGVSLRAAGWLRVAELDTRAGWDTPSRRRDTTYLSHGRYRWEKGREAKRPRPALPSDDIPQEALPI